MRTIALYAIAAFVAEFAIIFVVKIAGLSGAGFVVAAFLLPAFLLALAAYSFFSKKDEGGKPDKVKSVPVVKQVKPSPKKASSPVSGIWSGLQIVMRVTILAAAVYVFFLARILIMSGDPQYPGVHANNIVIEEEPYVLVNASHLAMNYEQYLGEEVIFSAFVTSVTDKYIVVEFGSILVEPDDPYMLEFVKKINWSEDQPQIHGEVALDENGELYIQDAYIGISFTCYPVEYNPPED